MLTDNLVYFQTGNWVSGKSWFLCTGCSRLNYYTGWFQNKLFLYTWCPRLNCFSIQGVPEYIKSLYRVVSENIFLYTGCPRIHSFSIYSLLMKYLLGSFLNESCGFNSSNRSSVSPRLDPYLENLILNCNRSFMFVC